MDEYTEVTQRSGCSRLTESVKELLMGLLLFLGSFGLLFWNEGRAVTQARALGEGRGAVVTVSPERVDRTYQDRLVHVSGRAAASGVLQDDEFGVSSRDALRLRRTVEMYQWEESSSSHTRKKVGGGEETVTTYTYEKAWSDQPVNSAGFKDKSHRNPGAFPVRSRSWSADPVRLGAFTLGPALTARIEAWQDLPAPPRAPAGMVPGDGGLYRGRSPGSPQVGDVRIRFQAVPATEVTVVAVQFGNSFRPYRAGNGQELLELALGRKSASEMFQAMEQSNDRSTWNFRFLGFGCMFGALVLLMGPVNVLVGALPLVGDLARLGSLLLALLLAATLSTATIAVSWIAVRPLVGVGLLAGVLGVLAGVLGLVRRRSA